jgi:hypothetical protein
MKRVRKNVEARQMTVLQGLTCITRPDRQAWEVDGRDIASSSGLWHLD